MIGGGWDAIIEYERAQEHRKWMGKAPWFTFPSEWEVQIMPPFGGAVVRFCVRYNNRHVSVYLDCYDRLGLFGEPYWEMYPYEDDVYRVPMDSPKLLIEKITEELNKGEKI